MYKVSIYCLYQESKIFHLNLSFWKYLLLLILQLKLLIVTILDGNQYTIR